MSASTEPRAIKLRARGLTKRFGAVTALDGLNFDVPDRSLLVLVGPSGCGKSTLLRLIAGLEEITDGELTMDGRRLNEVPAAKRDLAMVFQSYALYPHMTVAQNMSVGLRIAKAPKVKIAAKVADAAHILKLDGLLDRKPKALSGGQRQRVAIGRAIVREPEIFLFDEPLSNLDAALRTGMRLEIARLHQSLNATMIYVTHDQVEAMTLADRIIVMNEGRIEQMGSPIDLYERPDNAFVAGFLGSPRINMFPGRVEEGGVVRLGCGPVLTVPAAASAAPGDRVEIGIRPERLDLSGESAIEARVDVVERLGPQSVIYGLLPDESPITVVTDGKVSLAPGEALRVAVDPDGILVFDASGRRMEVGR